MAMVIEALPANEDRLESYRKAQNEDEICNQTIGYCNTGWPQKHLVEKSMIPYWKQRGYLTVHKGLLLFNHRIVVPQSKRKETLEKVHAGHQGIERCRMRIRSSIWWPGISKEVERMVQQCRDCAKVARSQREPLKISHNTDYPWQIAGSDLFELHGVHYLLVVDYFSRYPEIIKLTSTTSSAIISALKAIFSRFGIPEVLRTDNGPQYNSHEFSQFAKTYTFQHVTSSPRYPQSNGQAERTVQTVKSLLTQSSDPYIALLNYTATPLPWCSLSPAQLSMGRSIRTLVPQIDKHLIPEWPYMEFFCRENKKQKDRQKHYFDSHHRVHDLPEIPDNTDVWISTEGGPVEGTVVSQAGRPRSYIVETPSGRVQRNRRHLTVVPSPKNDPDPGATSKSSTTLEPTDVGQETLPPNPPTQLPEEPPRRIMTRSQTRLAHQE